MTLNRRKTLSLLGAGASAGVAAAAVGGLALPGMAAAADELGTGDSSMSDALIIDDFTQLPDSTIGGRWSYTSDRVMGGVVQRRRWLRRGRRSNGHPPVRAGQHRQQRRLHSGQPAADPRTLNADRYKGIEIDVLGNGEDYNVHLTTTRSFPPWRFYKHSFETSGEWVRHRLAWDDFTSESFRRALDPCTINRLNLTAYARDFEADLAVSRIALFA